ncbi:hypothetical protein K504DRAFT_274017 [Pleomassaria siparia CBS 279.74]|uniref:Uncharacterized protein n=1 Tax=Pleomassaria siparia CBS 279.74 TaxID=1314801 RepID=A0A6G1K954_9PLEO|nr:hypothetical protein K504DRAFT_274017 [Pleomassaria siparia CBS 279.74]
MMEQALQTNNTTQTDPAPCKRPFIREEISKTHRFSIMTRRGDRRARTRTRRRACSDMHLTDRPSQQTTHTIAGNRVYPPPKTKNNHPGRERERDRERQRQRKREKH